MGAEEAKHWGLVHDVVPRQQLMERARSLAAEIADGAPLALQALKEALGAMMHLPLPESFEVTRCAIRGGGDGSSLPEDVNEDCIVNVNDLLAIIGAWGSTCP